MRYYMLEDLLSPHFHTSAIKLAIFLNAWRLKPTVKAAIATKLQSKNRTLVYQPSCLPAFLPSCHAALHPTRLVNHLSPVLPEVWTEIYLFTVPVHTLSWIDTTDRLIIIVGAGTCTRQG